LEVVVSSKKLPVSVIICALNEEHRIKDAINSAKANNPFEIIVVEGGSVHLRLFPIRGFF
jgi:hypothetical protein